MASTSSARAPDSPSPVRVPKGKGTGKSSAKKEIHKDYEIFDSDGELDTRATLDNLISAIKRKPRDSSPEPPSLIADDHANGVYPQFATGMPAAAPFFHPPAPRYYPPYPGTPYFMPGPMYAPMLLDLTTNPPDSPTSENGDSVSDPDDSDSVHNRSITNGSANDNLQHLDEENPNLADPLCEPILDKAATALERWFHTPRSKSETMALLKQVERPANCAGLKVVEINEEVKKPMKNHHNDKDKK